MNVGMATIASSNKRATVIHNQTLEIKKRLFKKHQHIMHETVIDNSKYLEITCSITASIDI